MNEQQLEERFQLAVADEPPLGFDPDDIVDRATRRQRNRRAVTAVVAAVAAVAAITAVTNMVTTASYSDLPVQPAQPTSPPSPGWACRGEDPGLADLNAILARKTAEILPALPRTAAPVGMAFAHPRPGELCAASAVWPSVNGDSNSPSLGMVLQVVPGGEVTDVFTNQPAYVRTEEIKNPDGSVLSTYRKATPDAKIVSPSPPPGGESASLGALSSPVAVVVHQRADGSVIRAESDDLAVASVDQLKALATDPEITV